MICALCPGFVCPAAAKDNARIRTGLPFWELAILTYGNLKAKGRFSRIARYSTDFSGLFVSQIDIQ
jgi:hypothetical protein